MVSEKSQLRRDKSIWPYYKVPRIVKFTERESKMVVAMDWGRGKWEVV